MSWKCLFLPRDKGRSLSCCLGGRGRILLVVRVGAEAGCSWHGDGETAAQQRSLVLFPSEFICDQQIREPLSLYHSASMAGDIPSMRCAGRAGSTPTQDPDAPTAEQSWCSAVLPEPWLAPVGGLMQVRDSLSVPHCSWHSWDFTVPEERGQPWRTAPGNAGPGAPRLHPLRPAAPLSGSP